MARPWVHQSFLGAWGVLERDPIGVLLPAAGALFVQIVAIGVLRVVWGRADLFAVLMVVLAGHVGRVVLASPFRAPMIAAGARALDRPAIGWPRALPLVAADLLVSALELLAAAVVAVPLAGFAALATQRGVYVGGSLFVALAAIGAAVAALLVRAAFAYAPAEVVVGGRAALPALARAWRKGSGDRLQLAALVLGGDLVFALGGALCGAGALPGYPVGELAVLHRWVHREDG